MNGYPVWDGIPACSGTETDLWFTVDGSHVYTEKNLIQRICQRCPVKMQCADYSIKHDVDGYWAGTTTDDRRQIRRQLNIVPISLASNLNDWRPLAQ